MAIESRIQQRFIGENPSEIVVTQETGVCTSESETTSAKLEGWASFSLIF